MVDFKTSWKKILAILPGNEQWLPKIVHPITNCLTKEDYKNLEKIYLSSEQILTAARILIAIYKFSYPKSSISIVQNHLNNIGHKNTTSTTTTIKLWLKCLIAARKIQEHNIYNRSFKLSPKKCFNAPQILLPENTIIFIKNQSTLASSTSKIHAINSYEKIILNTLYTVDESSNILKLLFLLNYKPLTTLNNVLLSISTYHKTNNEFTLNKQIVDFYSSWINILSNIKKPYSTKNYSKKEIVKRLNSLKN